MEAIFDMNNRLKNIRNVDANGNYFDYGTVETYNDVEVIFEIINEPGYFITSTLHWAMCRTPIEKVHDELLLMTNRLDVFSIGDLLKMHKYHQWCSRNHTHPAHRLTNPSILRADCNPINRGGCSGTICRRYTRSETRC